VDSVFWGTRKLVDERLAFVVLVVAMSMG